MKFGEPRQLKIGFSLVAATFLGITGCMDSSEPPRFQNIIPVERLLDDPCALLGQKIRVMGYPRLRREIKGATGGLTIDFDRGFGFGPAETTTRIYGLHTSPYENSPYFDMTEKSQGVLALSGVGFDFRSPQSHRRLEVVGQINTPPPDISKLTTACVINAESVKPVDDT